MMRVAMLAASALLAAAAWAQGDRSERKFEVVWSVGSGDDATTSFAALTSIAVSPNGDVVAWDSRTPALRLYTDAGKFLRIIGRKGGGPGEYGAISGMAFAPDGRFYVWDSGNGRINGYKANGDFDTSFRSPVIGFSTQDGFRIDTQGRIWLNWVIFDRAAGKTQGAWIRARLADASVIDTVKAPQLEGSDPQLIAQSGGGMAAYSIPYGRYPVIAVTSAGELITGLPGATYVINWRHQGRAVKIERRFTPVRIPDAERAERKASIEYSMRQNQADWKWPSQDVPSVKPPYTRITSALDGRLWVTLSVESEKFTPEPPPAGRGNARPQITWRDARQQWDVFEPDGRFVGTVSAPRTLSPRVFRGDFAWGVMIDADDLPTLVKLKVSRAFDPG